MKIVIHAGSERRVAYTGRTAGKSWMVRDASLRAMYGDLEDRMMQCLRDTLTGRVGTKDLKVWMEEAVHVSPAAWEALRTLDDLEGHVFHGNQHTGGINHPHAHEAKHAHVKTVQEQLLAKKIKSAKMAVHALLSSGHPFTKDELAIAVGMDPKGKTINDYLTNLQNPNYAGPKGALKLAKNEEGMWHVVMPDGTPAPLPDTKVSWGKEVETPKLPPHLQEVVKKLNEPGHTVTEVHVPGFTEPPVAAPEPPPVVHAPPPPPVVEVPHVPEHATVKQSHLDVMKGAHPGSMPKSEADAHYKAHLTEAYEQLGVNAKADDLQSAALQFKEAKAAGMAAWATAVHGHPFKVKPQQVFKADTKLAEYAKEGMSQDIALEQWKKNTAAEKAGNYPPKPAPPKPATPIPTPAPVAVTDMGHAAEVKTIDYKTLRPKGFVDIDEDDIMSRKFSKGIIKLKKDLIKASSSASGNKATVEHKLRARLADKPNFQALVKRLGLVKEGYGSLESRLINVWAGSSGDTHDISVAMQIAVKDAFNIPDDHVEKVALQSLAKHGHDEDKVVAHGITALNSNINPPLQKHEVATARAALREFVLAQYEETQAHLKSLGHDHVFIVRGMKTQVSHNYTAPSAVKLQPASSFSANYETSRSGFTGGGYGTMFVCKVPREQVLSTYMTGFGCTVEHEAVVLAHDKLKAWTLPAQKHVATSATAAQEYLQTQLKKVNPGLKASKAPKSSLEEDDEGPSEGPY